MMKLTGANFVNRLVLLVIFVRISLWWGELHFLGFNYLSPQKIRRKRSPPYGVALCAIQKQAVPYLEEFVDHHISIGISHVYIYDNSDDFETKPWLSSYKEKEKKTKNSAADSVTVIHYPGVSKQMPAYNDCLKRLNKEKKYEWIAILDTDELIVLKKHQHIMELLNATVAKSPNAGGLALNWHMYGYNNETKYRPVPLSKRFQRRNPITAQHVKTISRAKMVRTFHNPHYAFYWDKDRNFLNMRRAGYSVWAVDTNGKPVGEGWEGGGDVGRPAFNPDRPNDVAVVNHYHAKSLEEFISRCDRGLADAKRADMLAMNLLYCKNRTEILAVWDNEKTIFDDVAWQHLKKALPEKYAKYDD